jgi:HD-like signal output (HDOD) protein
MFGFLKKKQVDPKRELKKVLGAYALPSFPGIVLEVMKELRNADASARSVARILAGDPGMSIRLLKLVNSAAYGSVRQTESVQQAVAVMGMSQVESVVLSIGVQTALPSSEAPGFEVKRFWRAAARRASAAGAFASMLHPATRAHSFTASLLQDMAVPLLANSKPRRYGPVLEAWHAGEGELPDLELDQMGCHHGDVATWLCDEWTLPEQLAESIGGHHGAEDLACPPAVRIVSVLKENEKALGIDELVELARGEYNVAPDRALHAVQESFDKAEELARLFA